MPHKINKGASRKLARREKLEPYDGPVVRYLHYLAQEPYYYDIMRMALELSEARRKIIFKLLLELQSA